MNPVFTSREIKQALRRESISYPCYFIADDGAAISFQGVRENYRLVLYATRHKLRNGWGVVGVDVNWEDEDLWCEVLNVRIPCVYPSDPADPADLASQGESAP